LFSFFHNDIARSLRNSFMSGILFFFFLYAKQENSAATSEVAEMMTDDPPAIAIVRCGLEQAPASGA
jgi:hypothetical protein